MTGTDQLSLVFSALADPTRRAILLERAALISRTQSGKWRESRLQAAALRDTADWIDRYQHFWDVSLTPASIAADRGGVVR